MVLQLPVKVVLWRFENKCLKGLYRFQPVSLVLRAHCCLQGSLPLQFKVNLEHNSFADQYVFLIIIRRWKGVMSSDVLHDILKKSNTFCFASPLLCFFFFFLIYLWMISSDQKRNQNVVKQFFCFLVCSFWPHCYRFRAVESCYHIAKFVLDQPCVTSPVAAWTTLRLSFLLWKAFSTTRGLLTSELNLLSTLLPVTWLTSKHCTTWPWTEFAVMSIAGKIGNCQVFSTCE